MCRRNPGEAVGAPSITGALTHGFSMDALKAGGLLAGGAVLNGIVRSLVMSKGVGTLVTDPTTQKYVSYPLGLLTAGLLGYLGNMVKPGIGGALTMGGVVGELGRVWQEQVQPRLPAIPGLSDLAELLTPQAIGRAIPLGHMGDVLTPEAVRAATPLSGMSMGADLAEMSAGEDTEVSGFGDDDL